MRPAWVPQDVEDIIASHPFNKRLLALLVDSLSQERVQILDTLRANKKGLGLKTLFADLELDFLHFVLLIDALVKVTKVLANFSNIFVAQFLEFLIWRVDKVLHSISQDFAAAKSLDVRLMKHLMWQSNHPEQLSDHTRRETFAAWRLREQSLDSRVALIVTKVIDQVSILSRWALGRSRDAVDLQLAIGRVELDFGIQINFLLLFLCWWKALKATPIIIIVVSAEAAASRATRSAPRHILGRWLPARICLVGLVWLILLHIVLAQMPAVLPDVGV